MTEKTAKEEINNNPGMAAPEGQRVLEDHEMIVMPLSTINIITQTLGDLPWKNVAHAFQAIQQTAEPLAKHLEKVKKDG